jgi:hypothetical protein
MRTDAPAPRRGGLIACNLLLLARPVHANGLEGWIPPRRL